MKVVFAGPSIHPSAEVRAGFPGLVWRGPARQGDIARQVHEGGVAIALIDGVYGTLATVWHKEILLALSEGVQVIGGASLGALRAVECGPFGMEGIGDVFHDYLRGTRVDDGDVALLHAPEELDHVPMTETLVDVDATLAILLAQGLLSEVEARRIAVSAARTFFWDRTLDVILDSADLSMGRAVEITASFEANRVRQKRSDALRVIERLRDLPDVRAARTETWRPAATRSLRRVMALKSPPTEGRRTMLQVSSLVD